MSEAKKATETKKKEPETKEPEQKMVRVLWPLEKGDAESQFVSCNGIEMYVKRGEWVEVPECIAEVIEHNMTQDAAAFRAAQASENVYLGDI